MSWATVEDVMVIRDMLLAGYQNKEIVSTSRLSVATVYKIINFFTEDETRTVADYFAARNANRRKCGRKPIEQTPEEIEFCMQQLAAGKSPVSITKSERPISISKSTFYNRVQEGVYDVKDLPRGRYRTKSKKD